MAILLLEEIYSREKTIWVQLVPAAASVIAEWRRRRRSLMKTCGGVEEDPTSLSHARPFSRRRRMSVRVVGGGSQMNNNPAFKHKNVVTNPIDKNNLDPYSAFLPEYKFWLSSPLQSEPFIPHHFSSFFSVINPASNTHFSRTCCLVVPPYELEIIITSLLDLIFSLSRCRCVRKRTRARVYVYVYLFTCLSIWSVICLYHWLFVYACAYRYVCVYLRPCVAWVVLLWAYSSYLWKML